VRPAGRTQKRAAGLTGGPLLSQVSKTVTWQNDTTNRLCIDLSLQGTGLRQEQNHLKMLHISSYLFVSHSF
jgi:hypothetical protein